MFTVLTWLWTQPGVKNAYSAEHVNIWAAMVRRNLSMPHRLACVTDIPAGIDSRVEIIAPPREFENVVLPSWGPSRPQCLRRLSMFRHDAAAIFGERFVCMDLDCVIGGALDPLFDDDVEFRILAGTAPSRPYNGSMMMLTAGARPQVYECFTVEGAVAAGARFVGSDQAWISHVLPREATWEPDDGVSWWAGPKCDAPRALFFPGSPKPWQVVAEGEDAWVQQHYRGERGGRCLVLGYAPDVWRGVERALATGRFDAVIASPEAAAHWPGEVLAVAPDDDHADRMVEMYGFTDAVFCGRTKREAA